MKYINGLLLIIILIAVKSCKDPICKNRVGPYQFEMPVSLTPRLDTFHIGDTIHISSIFNKNIYERESQDSFLLDDFLFYPSTTLLRIDTTPFTRNDIEDFDLIVPSEYSYSLFVVSDELSRLSGQYNNEGDQYSLEYKLIPKKEGLYMFSQISHINPQNENQDFRGRCTGFQSEGFFSLNNKEHNNMSLLLNSPDPYMHTFSDNQGESFYDSGGYCFYVVE